MKKKIRILSWIFLCLLSVAVLGEWSIRAITSRDWFRTYIISKTQEALQREVRADKIAASLFGLQLRGVEISEEGGFEKGTFLIVERAQIRFSLGHLLHAHFKIHHLILQNVDVYLIRLKDGKFNFETLGNSTSQTTDEEDKTSTPFRTTLHSLSLENLSFSYQDLQENQTFKADHIYLNVQNFKFDGEFPLTLNTTLEYHTNDQHISIPAGMRAKIYLGNLDLSQAYAEILDLFLKHNGSLLRFKGRIDNWQDPQFWAQLTSKVLSSTVASPWTELPKFEIKDPSLYVAGKFVPSASTITLSSGTLHLPGGDVFVAGRFNYNKNTYNSQGKYTFDLERISAWLPEEYRKMGLKGFLDGKISADTQQMQTEFVLKNGGYFNSSTGRFSELDASFTIAEEMNFKTGNLQGNLTGKLNENPFQGKLSIQQKPTRIDVDLNAFSKRVALPAVSLAPTKEEEPEFVQDVTIEPIADTSWSLPPISLKANIKVDSLDAPYLYGTNLQFSSDIEGVTPQLKEAHGVLSLKMGKGKILDLYKLTNANAVTKVLFLSLNITGKVFNSLNVFSVLNGLGKGLVSAVTKGEKIETEERMVVQTMTGPDGELMEVMVPYTEQKSTGQLAYEKFETDVAFNKGVASIKKGTFVSDMMSFRLDGTTDFQSGKIAMKVHAAPGKHEVDGMLPLALNISGTVSEPKGSMSMVGSVTSLVKQTVANNVVSRQVKKGVKGIFGIFKKKEEENPEKEKITSLSDKNDELQEEVESLVAEENNSDSTLLPNP